VPLRRTEFDLKGVEEMQRQLRFLAEQFPDKVGKGLRLEAEQIMTKSKQSHVPVDLGTLRASGHVNKPEQKGKDIQVVMVYGNAATPYALAVHEHPSSSSPPSWKGVPVTFSPKDRGPKYLERPLQDAIPGMAIRIGKKMIEGG
jgi:hypothetical protein